MTTKQQPNQDAPTPKPKQHVSLPLILVVILSLIAIGLAGYAIKTNHKLHHKLNNIKNTLANEKNQYKALQEKTDEMTLQQTALNNNIDGLSKSLQHALSQQLYQNQDWLLLKARYYLELAQINEHWTENYDTSVKLLQDADMLLKSLTNKEVLQIRQAIAKEISDLQALPVLDLPGILSKLDAIQSDLADLKIKPQDVKPAETSNSPPQETSSWKANVQKSLSFLEKMVVIKHHDADIKPLLSPLYQATIKESIYLNLQQAQWAAINKNQPVYNLALKQARTAIQQTFDMSSKQTTTLLSQLQELSKINLVADKPQQGEALSLLNQFIDTKDAQDLPSSQKGN